MDPHSDSLIARCGGSASLHPDFGTIYGGAPWGIPFITVSGSQPRVPVTFTYAGESDPGRYPISPHRADRRGRKRGRRPPRALVKMSGLVVP